MALTHNPNSEHTAAPRQVLVANPHLHGTPYDRKVALIIESGRLGFRGVVVNQAFRKSLIAAKNSGEVEGASRLSAPEPIELGVINWGPGKLEDEVRAGVWMPTATTIANVLAREDDLWATLVRGIGQSVLRDALGIGQFPQNILVN